MNTAKMIALVAPILASQARRNVTCVIDMTRELDLVRASELGVNTERLLVSQPDDVQQGTEILETLARSGACDMIVIGWPGELPRVSVDCAARSGCALVSL